MPLIRTGPEHGPRTALGRAAAQRKATPAMLRTRTGLLSRPAVAVTLAFLAASVAGTLLLMLPVATEDGSSNLRVSLFTATSALSVTGLTVVDTAGHWSTFGECVLMGLMQLGGLGIMSATTLLGLVVANRLGLRSRLLVAAETGTLDLGTVRRLLSSVIRISIAIEVLAWIAISLRLALGYDMTPGRALYEGLFHSVSAYNNGGFALYPDSLVRYGADVWLLLPIAIAFVLGALGYPVLLEVLRRRRLAFFSVHTRLTVLTFGLLGLFGPALVAFGEWRNQLSLGVHGGAFNQVAASIFSGLSSGSAGFNVIDYAHVDSSTLLGTNVLMFIGGGSGGTAGGIKVGTVAVLALAVIAEVRGDQDVNVFGRRLAASTIRQALAVTLLALIGVLAGTFALLSMTQVRLDAALFEVVSAFSSSGLSTGITAGLPAPAQYLLVALMFIGRVGPITVATALALRSHRKLYRYPETRPLVG